MCFSDKESHSRAASERDERMARARNEGSSRCRGGRGRTAYRGITVPRHIGMGQNEKGED